MRRPRLAAQVGALLLCGSGVAAAHQVGGTRFDAPLPLPLLYLGAGATVAATAGWLAVSGGTGGAAVGTPRLGVVPRRVGLAVAWTARGAFFLLFVLALTAGLAGPRVAAENLATVFVWPVWLHGVAVLSALVGSPWRVLSPWRTLYDGLRRLEGGDVSLVAAYPSWLGEWPAFAGFVVGIGLLENLTGVPESPRLTALLVAGYAAVMVAGAVAFGEPWLDRADALAVLYRLFGRVAPVRIDAEPDGYRVSVRSPWVGCTPAVRSLAVAGFVVAALFTVSFDGFASTAAYGGVRSAVAASVGLGSAAGVVLYGLGLAGFLGAFAAVVAVSTVAGGRRAARGEFLAAAPTLLPIAVAYEVAHTYPFVARNLGQLVVVLVTAAGGSLEAVAPLAWLSLPAYWGSQVLLVVGGHVVAVVAAHRVAVERYPTRRRVLRADAPLTALMVAFTVLSLWLVSRPLAG